MSATFKHSKLKDGEIRLLRIKDDLANGLLQVSLQTVTLQKPEDSFIAVSWTWGEESKVASSLQIQLEGQPFTVRPNLLEMLTAFHVRNIRSYLWIDAICIDQDKANTQEKDSQIPLMADIFKTAKEVYVWLGPSAHESDYLMECLSKNQGIDFTSVDLVNSFALLLQRPWWTRTWILQEYVQNEKSPVMLCGQAPAVSADHMLQVWVGGITAGVQFTPAFTAWVAVQRLGSVNYLRNLRRSKHTSDGPYKKRDLRNALSWLKTFNATYPCDKIYGALGVIDKQYREDFVGGFGVNSRKDCAEVFLDATIYLLKNEKNSTIFYDFPFGSQSSSPNTPSWNLNFNFNSDLLSRTRGIVRLGDVTADYLDTQREDVEISPDRRILTVRGIPLGKVKETIVVNNDTLPGWDDANQIKCTLLLPHLLHQIQALVEQNQNVASARQQHSEPLWKTLIAGCFGSIGSVNIADIDGCQARFEELMAIPLVDIAVLERAWSRQPSPPQSPKSPEQLQAESYSNAVSQVLHQDPRILNAILRTLSTGRTFFTGTNGTYGISEGGIKKGGSIVLLLPHHYVPFVLREQGKFHEMMSVAYVPGPTRDAAIAELERGRPLVKFEIK